MAQSPHAAPNARPGWRTGDPVAIPGDYQWRALTEGPAVQRFWHQRKLELVGRTVPPQPGWRALDAGCGSGVVAHFLAEQGADVDAVDSNDAAIRFARQRFARQGLRFHHGRLGELDFADESFDLVVCMEVVEHLVAEQVVDLLRRLGRLLAPRGRLLLTTPNVHSLWPAVEATMDLLRLSPPMRHGQHVTRFTRRRLERALGEAGLAAARYGRFCGLAPFAALLSWRLAERLDRLEWRLGQPLGNLLFAIAGRAS